MSTPEPADPQAEPDWYLTKLAPPLSDGFYRAIAAYCAAENAKAEPQPELEAEDARVWAEASHEEYADALANAAAAQAEAAPADCAPEPEAEPW